MKNQQPLLTIEEFKEQHVDIVANIITRSFVSMNKIWKNYSLPYDDVKRVIRGKILPTVIGKLAFIMKENQDICAAAFQIDMIDFLRMPSMPNNIEFFKKLGKVGAQLQKGLNPDEMQRGTIVYSMYAVIDPEYSKKGYSLRFWWQLFSTAKLVGFHCCYSRISSQVSLKMLQKLGAEIVSEAEFAEDGLKEKIWMIKINLLNPFPTYQMLKSMMKKTVSKIQFSVMQEKHLEDATRLLTKNFISMNPIWNQFNLKYDEIYTIFRGKLLKALEGLMTFVLFLLCQVMYEDTKMIGVTVQMDMLDYVKLPPMPNHLTFFEKLDKVGSQLQKGIDLSKNIKGDVVYGLYGVIDPQFANKGYSLRFWWQCMAVGKSAGWKFYYSRISNIYSLKLLQKLGAQIIAQTEMEEGGKKSKFWMVKVDFSKPLPSFTKLKEMLQKEKKPQAKL